MKKESKEKAVAESGADPLVLTVSQHAALSPEEQRKFREAHGTVTSDPISPSDENAA